MLGLIQKVLRETAGSLHVIFLILWIQNVIHGLAEQFLLVGLDHLVFNHWPVVVDDLVHADEEVLSLLHLRLEFSNISVFSRLKNRHMVRRLIFAL